MINGGRRDANFSLPTRDGFVWTVRGYGSSGRCFRFCRGAGADSRFCDRTAGRLSAGRFMREGDDDGRQCGMVARLRHLSGLSALVSGHDRRRQRRPAGHNAARRAYRFAGRRCDLAVAVLQIPHGRHGLRHIGLLRRRSDVRHDRGFRRAGGRSPSARIEADHRPGAFPFFRSPPLVHRKPGRPGKPQGRLVCLGRSEA